MRLPGSCCRVSNGRIDGTINNKTFEKTQDVLNKLTEKAMREYELRKTKEMGFDEL